MSTLAAAGEPRRPSPPARMQPLLLGAGVAAALPAVASGHGAPVVVAILAVVALVSIGSWALLRTRLLHAEQRRIAGLWLALLSAGSLLLVLFAGGDRPPDTYLLIASALMCALASIDVVVRRWVLQLSVVVGTGAALASSERELLDVLVPVALVLLVGVLTNVLALELTSARRSEVDARADAERRTELLQAVRALPDGGPDEVVAATVRTLRSLAFDAARVTVLRDGQLHEVDEAGGVSAGQVAREDSLERRAIDEDRTITSTDHRRQADEGSALPDVRSVVVAPIRVAGHPAGALLGGRREPGEPSAAAVEVAEVLAAHLGVVLDTQAQVRRQRELLERMADLDQMRSGFAREVSSELRDPLTIVRTVGEALTRHGDGIDAARRRELLEQMCDHADDLRATIDALLDFSRFQLGREEAEVVAIPLVELLVPVLRATGATIDPPLAELRELGLAVEVDVVLVSHALEILLVAGLADVDDEPVATLLLDERRDTDLRLLVVRHDGSVPSTLVRSLVSQLLVAGGASLDDGAAPVVVLRRVGVPVSEGPTSADEP